jgi:uncharacterized membrane protein
MRTPLDRLRHALSFEILALLLVVPLAALAMGQPVQDMGVVGVVSATLATLWNMVFNWLFDHALRSLTGTTQKRPRVRILHAILFEAGLLLVLMPFIAWYLQISLLAAFLLDAGLAAFYLVYAFGFNWAYDRLFPLPEWQNAMPAD